MKIWRNYSEYLLSGEWHIHTNYADGKNTIREYCQVAVKKGIPLLAFTEHVRCKLDYDFNHLIQDIELARRDFDITILSGCEAKILPNGELDVDPSILREVDYGIFACHSFPSDVNLYKTCLKKVIKNKYVNTWAHPGSFLSKNRMKLSNQELMDIFTLLKEFDVLLELNKKHNTPPPSWIRLAERCGVKLVRGSDIHSILEM